MCFSRDGRRFAYVSTRRDGKSNDIWVADVEHPDARHGAGQGLALGGEADAAGGTFQQRTAEAFLQALDRQAQGRLGEVQAFAGLGEAEALRHGEEGAQLLDGHLFVFLINGLEKQT